MAAIKKRNMAADRTISQKFQTTFFHRYKLCFSIIRFNIDWRTILVKFAVLLFVHSAVRVRTSLVCKYISQIGNCVVFREDLYELGTFPVSRRLTPEPDRARRDRHGDCFVLFSNIFIVFISRCVRHRNRSTFVLSSIHHSRTLNTSSTSEIKPCACMFTST